MAKFLRIALWNANSLAQHKDEIQLFLQQSKIDIPLINETHFTTKSYFKIPHYNMYCTNHPDGTAHAGTAVIIKQSLRATKVRRRLPPSHINSSQNSAIRVNGNCSLFLTQIQSKKGSLRIVLQRTGPKIRGRRRL